VFGVGYDGVPIDYCRGRGNQGDEHADVLTDDVADVATGLVLMSGRGFAKADRFVRAGQWTQRGFELTTKLAAALPHPRPRPHRQGDREAPRGDRHAHRVHGTRRASRALPTGSCRTSWRSRASRTS